MCSRAPWRFARPTASDAIRYATGVGRPMPSTIESSAAPISRMILLSGRIVISQMPSLPDRFVVWNAWPSGPIAISSSDSSDTSISPSWNAALNSTSFGRYGPWNSDSTSATATPAMPAVDGE
ncbi:hypothetical protein D3C83_18130 [compost metagenome]